MKITKYASHDCVKCRVLDKLFNTLELPCPVDTLYIEDEGEESFVTKGVMSFPTLILENNDKQVKLSGTITPTQIQDAIKSIS